MLQKSVLRALVCVSVCLVGGCAKFDEVHYFRSEKKSDGEVANYYRLHVWGDAGLSSARYVSGFYDERAVDLFFNELRSGKQGPDVLFQTNQKSPGSDATIAPLDPTKHGAFVMVMSTRADAIVNTIGNFADNNVVADAVTNLVNRDRVRAASRTAAQAPIVRVRAKAVADELQGLFGMLPTAATPSRAATEAAYLRILNAIAHALGSSQSFTSLSQAEGWLTAQLQRSARSAP